MPRLRARAGTPGPRGPRPPPTPARLPAAGRSHSAGSRARPRSGIPNAPGPARPARRRAWRRLGEDLTAWQDIYDVSAELLEAGSVVNTSSDTTLTTPATGPEEYVDVARRLGETAA